MEMKSIYEHAKYLANRWYQEVSSLSKPSSVTKELDLLQLKIFASCAKLHAYELSALEPHIMLCQSACEKLHQEDFERSLWQILLTPYSNELQQLISHHNSHLRLQGLTLAWITRKWFSTAQSINFLLDNTADKLCGVEESFGLACWLAKEHQGSCDFAEYAIHYVPKDVSFADQYKERVKELLQHKPESLCGWLIELESRVWQSLYDDCFKKSASVPAEQLNLAFSKISMTKHNEIT